MGNIETSVQDWATEAADAFLNRSIGLNHSIKKIASRESLNREKVARVVEESNRLVFLKMFDKQADKTFVFDVADTSKIVEAAPMGGDGAAAMARVTPAPVSKTASEKTASQKTLEQAFNGRPIQYAMDYQSKAILAVEILREKAAMTQERITAASVDFCKIAQNMVSQEGYGYPELVEAMCDLRPKYAKRIAVLLKVAAAQLGETFKLPDMTKFAGAAVNAGEHDIVTQISCSKMPVEVINGSHKIVVALDTLISQVTEADRANKNLWSADDSVKYLRREILNYLATNKNV